MVARCEAFRLADTPHVQSGRHVRVFVAVQLQNPTLSVQRLRYLQKQEEFRKEMFGLRSKRQHISIGSTRLRTYCGTHVVRVGH